VEADLGRQVVNGRVGEDAALRVAGGAHGPLRLDVEPGDRVVAVVLELGVDVGQRAAGGAVAGARRARAVDVDGGGAAVRPGGRQQWMSMAVIWPSSVPAIFTLP